MIQNGIFDPLKIRKFEKNVYKMSILRVFLQKIKKFGSNFYQNYQKMNFTVKLIQKIRKSRIIVFQNEYFMVFFFKNTTNLAENSRNFNQKITKNILRGHWSIVDHPADFLPDWWFFEIFLIFSRFWDFRSWIGNFWVVSISGIRIYFCFLGFTLVP